MAKITGARRWDTIHPKAAGKGDDKQPAYILRLEVPGGWLVAHAWGDTPGPLVFLPDPDHGWDPKA